MRTILVIIIVLVIALLLTPFWYGMRAEDEYNNLIETISKYENLEIVSKKYNRGWLISSSEIKYTLQDAENENIQISQRDMLYHGPIPLGLLSKGKIMLKPVMAVIETDADFKSDSKEKFAELINSVPEAHFQTTLSLSGNGTTEVSVPPANDKLEDGTKLNWSGLDGYINFSPDLSSVSSVFNSSGFEIEDDKALVRIKGINVESNLNYPAENYKNPLGDMSVNIEELHSEGKETDGPNKVIINNFVIRASTSQQGNLLGHDHSLEIGSITVGGNSYGPGIYELEIRNVDKAAFEEIQLAVTESQNSEGVYETDMISAQIMKTLPTLIKSSPEIEITKLSITTDEGEITGHAIIKASGDSLNSEELAVNPIFLMAAISADITLSVSKPLMDNLFKDYKIEEISDELLSSNKTLPSEEELQAMGNERAQAEIKDMLDQKILILKDGKYELEASYSLGQITLNGNPLDLSAIMNQL